MSARRNSRRSVRSNFVPSFESLEKRELLSGNVTVINAGGLLEFIGDAAANDVVVTNPSPGAFHFASGASATTFNGAATADVTGITGPTFALMGAGGGDTVHFSGVNLPGFVDIFAGVGTNTYTIDGTSTIGSFFNYFGSINNDTLSVSNTTINGSVSVLGSGGVDSASFNACSIASFFYSFDGFGANATTLTNTNVGAFMTIYNIGGGDLGGMNAGLATTTDVTGGTFGGPVAILNVLGADRSGFCPTSLTGAYFQDNGPGDANVEVCGPVSGGITVFGFGGHNTIYLGTAPTTSSAASVFLSTGGFDSEIDTSLLTVSGGVSIFTAGGNNTVSLNSTSVGGTTNIFTGGGADVVALSPDPFATAPSLFTGQVTVNTGLGNDLVRLGDPAGANSIGHYHTGISVDGGPGTDSIDYINHGNLFDTGAALTFTNIENNLEAAPVLSTTSTGTLFANGTPIAVDPLLVVSDADDPYLGSATVSFTAGFEVGADTLNFTNQNGITGSFNATTGVLSLTGAATLAQYQAALRSVTYSNAGLTPAQGARTIAFVGVGGGQTSNSLNRTVVLDTVVPTVTVTQSLIQANPTNASPINFTVTFSEVVTGFTTAGLTLGGTAPGTLSALITGSGALYNVAVSGMTGSGTVTVAVNAGAAHDLAANPNTAAPAVATVTYDITPPTVSVAVAATQVDPTNALPINFTVTFSETVVGFTHTSVTLGGTAPGTLSAVVTGSGAVYNVAVGGMTGSGTVTLTLPAGAAHDPATNASIASPTTEQVTYDITPPAATINVAAGQPASTNASPINFTVVFSEDVTGFSAAGVILGGTALPTTAVVTGSGTTYNVAVSGMSANGTVTATLAAGAATDAAGNGSLVSTSTLNSVDYTLPNPTVTINQAVGQADPTNASPVNFTVVFSAPVTGFTSAGVILGGTAPGTLVATITGSGTTYNVAVSGMTGSGTVTANVAAGAAVDAFPLPNTASTSTDNVVTYDITAPTVTVAAAVAQANPTNASPINFTVTFSEVVTGFSSAGLSLGGTAPGTLVALVTGSGTTYNVAVSGMTGSGTVIVSVFPGAATDAAGNLSLASAGSATVTYDITAPTATVALAAGQSSPTSTSPINFTVTFSEVVTGFGVTGLTLGGTAPGTLAAIVTGSGTTYNVAVSGMTAGAGTVTVAVNAGVATDAAGNPNTASTAASADWNTLAPLASVAAAVGQANPTNASPINFTVTFTEVVTGFSSAGLTLGGTATGTLAAVVTGSGTTYNVAVSGMTGTGTVTVAVNAGAAVNGASTPNLASLAASVNYDITAPTVGVAVAAGQLNPTGTQPVNFTVTFSKVVTGFTSAGVSFTGSTAPGTLTALVTGSGTTWNVAVSGATGSGTIVVGVAAGAAHDLAGNASTASPGTATVTFNSGIVNFATVTTPVNITLSANPSGTVVGGVTFLYDNTGFPTDSALVNSTGVHGTNNGALVLTFPSPATVLNLTFDVTGAASAQPDSMIVIFSNTDTVTVPGTFSAGTISGTLTYTALTPFTTATIFFTLGATNFDLTAVTYG